MLNRQKHLLRNSPPSPPPLQRKTHQFHFPNHKFAYHFQAVSICRTQSNQQNTEDQRLKMIMYYLKYVIPKKWHMQRRFGEKRCRWWSEGPDLVSRCVSGVPVVPVCVSCASGQGAIEPQHAAPVTLSAHTAHTKLWHLLPLQQILPLPSAVEIRAGDQPS